MCVVRKKVEWQISLLTAYTDSGQFCHCMPSRSEVVESLWRGKLWSSALRDAVVRVGMGEKETSARISTGRRPSHLMQKVMLQ